MVDRSGAPRRTHTPPERRSACAGTRTNGKPCRARSARDSAFCMWHDPDRALDRSLALRKAEATIRREALRSVRFALSKADHLTPDQLRTLKELEARLAEANRWA